MSDPFLSGSSPPMAGEKPLDAPWISLAPVTMLVKLLASGFDSSASITCDGTDHHSSSNRSIFACLMSLGKSFFRYARPSSDCFDVLRSSPLAKP